MTQREARYPVPEPLRHPLLLGDWSRWVRDPIDLLRAYSGPLASRSRSGPQLPGRDATAGVPAVGCPDDQKQPTQG